MDSGITQSNSLFVADKTAANEEKLVSEGLRFMQIQRYGDAVVSFSDALELNPLNPQLWENRGRALLMLGDRDRALQDLTRARQLRISS